jgi:hypothetical protein
MNPPITILSYVMPTSARALRKMAVRRSQGVNPEIIFEKAVENDIPGLTEVMTQAFDDDTRRLL